MPERRRRRHDRERSDHDGHRRRKKHRSRKHRRSYSHSSEEEQIIEEPSRDTILQSILLILREHPEMESDLYKIFENIDKGKKIDITSVINEELKGRLASLFQELSLDEIGRKQIFKLRSDSYLFGKFIFPVFGRALQERERETAERKQKKVLGPTMPADMGEITNQADAYGPQLPRQQAVPDGDSGSSDDLAGGELVGPLPASAGGGAPKDAHEEINRIISKAGSNSYEILDVDSELPTKNIVKKYLKISLLIHPDKCSHPKAQEAFTILNKAKEELRNEQSRSQLDDKMDDAKLWDMAVAEAKRQEASAQWKNIKMTGKMATNGPLVRESWMTEIPTEVRPSAPVQRNVTKFSR